MRIEPSIAGWFHHCSILPGSKAGKLQTTVFRTFDFLTPTKIIRSTLIPLSLSALRICIHLAQTVRKDYCCFEQDEKMNKTEHNMQPMHLSETNFEAEVLQSKQPVLVIFWAPWSRPCQVLDPVLQELASTWQQRAKVAKLNADECLDLSLCYDIQSIPTLLYFVEGKPRLRIVGTATKEAILAKLKPFDEMNKTVTLAKGASGAGRQPGKEN